MPNEALASLDIERTAHRPRRPLMPNAALTLIGPVDEKANRTLTVLVAPGDPTGYSITHPYVENLYLPIIGPSTYVLLRLLDRLADQHPDTFTIAIDDLAHRIGLGNNGTANRTTHTIDRLCAYRLAALTAPDTIVFPRHLPALTNRQLDRLRPDVARLDSCFRMTRIEPATT
jgi:hypothetical protein